LKYLLLLVIYIPLVFRSGEYVNEWGCKIFVDVGAAEENALIAGAWNYMDPSPTVMELNPEFEFRTPAGWLFEYANLYTIEDGSYYWWTGVGEEEKCISKLCITQWPDGFKVNSDLDIDVIIAKVVKDKDYCDTCVPGKPPG
jgi:hypothetical protein